MTFSIVARCAFSGAFGIAAATGMPGVGKLLTHARAQVGAVATQGLLNPYLGIDGIDALTRSSPGKTPASAVLNKVMDGDGDRDYRQVAMIDDRGNPAIWTGRSCLPWAGHRSGPGYAIQGNLLPGPEVLAACEDAFLGHAGEDFSMRLLLALEAGEAAGGDKRGTQSATIYIVENEAYPLWDIRIDHHPAPMAELRRVYRHFADNLIPHIRAMPSRRPGRQPQPESGTSPC